MENKFEETDRGIFKFVHGPASEQFDSPPCPWKICLTVTDEIYLSQLLFKISKRRDYYFVKYTSKSSPRARDGMMLGRIFLASKKNWSIMEGTIHGQKIDVQHPG